MSLMLERRRAHFLLDMRLMMRRLAHYMAVTIDHRVEWQRLMTRTRCLDSALKELFTDGVETPDGGRFGGKGFRSTWQEGVVAVATALQRQPDAPRDARPGEGYDGDVVAPMIATSVLVWPWVTRHWMSWQPTLERSVRIKTVVGTMPADETSMSEPGMSVSCPQRLRCPLRAPP